MVRGKLILLSYDSVFELHDSRSPFRIKIPIDFKLLKYLHLTV